MEGGTQPGGEAFATGEEVLAQDGCGEWLPARVVPLDG